jgi:AraC family transcriptional regulator
MNRMNPRIESLESKKLVGMHENMSLANNKTGMLWGSFMPRFKEIENKVSDLKYSLQVFDSDYFKAFNPQKEFEKWALVEVAHFGSIPAGMEAFELMGGLYAVFFYKGNQQEAFGVFQQIYGDWIPNSSYDLDHRPHFEIPGPKYKNNDAESEEEIWIPVIPKATN